MKNADLFMMTSYHEAAPMVIDEARCLGLPVLTVRTTSSEEMVTAHNSGWVCDNDQQALETTLDELMRDGESLRKKKLQMRTGCVDNTSALKQFEKIVGD